MATSATAPVILISAGSAGLGAATARLFCRNGYRVVVNYSSNAERANRLLAEFSGLSSLPAPEHASAFAAVKADLAKREDVTRLVEEAVRKMGRLDVVFSNGGWTRIRDMTSIDGKVHFLT
jgi:NAD(P)-dependent dehydrogenase (short-subunit alcohol dehydrogenase family)